MYNGGTVCDFIFILASWNLLLILKFLRDTESFVVLFLFWRSFLWFMTLDLYCFDVLKCENRFCALPRFSWDKRKPIHLCGVGLKKVYSLEWLSLYNR